jgi:hypothetical protein
MSRTVCKIIIDNGVWGLSESLRQSLTDPNLYCVAQPAIPEKIRLGLLDKLAKIDIAAYAGGEVPVYGLGGIMVQLEDYSLISPDVWKIFLCPSIDSKVQFKVTEDYVIE